jgi:hypothetical protein
MREHASRAIEVSFTMPMVAGDARGKIFQDKNQMHRWSR